MAVSDKPAAVATVGFGQATWFRAATILANWLRDAASFPPCTVAELPPADDVGAGARGFVTDANATTFASVVAGGGANGVPVFSDGSNWRIG